MSTFCNYIVWAGILKSALEHLSDEQYAEFQARVRRDSEWLEEVDMHGEVVGYGAIVHRLDWVPAGDNPPLLYLPTLAAKSEGILKNVRSCLTDAGMPIHVDLFHHIDLGG